MSAATERIRPGRAVAVGFIAVVSLVAAQDVSAKSGTTAQSVLAIDPTRLEFGSIVVSTPTAPRRLKLANNSIAPLEILSIAFSDPSYAQTAGPTPPFSLPANVETTIELTCTPDQLGQHDAIATITTDGEPATAMLECRGIPRVWLSPDPIGFGRQPIAVASTPIIFGIENTGTSDLMVTGIAVGGADAADFAVRPRDLPLTLPGDSSTGFFITFTPSRNGDEIAELDLQTSDATAPRPIIAMTGTGYTPHLRVSPMSLDLGNVAIHHTSAPSVVMVENTGDSELVTALEISGPEPPQFWIDRITLAIPVGESMRVNVVFAPYTMGNASAVLAIHVTDPPLAIPLTATGVPDLELTPTSIDFGAQLVDAPSLPRTVTLTNHSAQAVQIAQIAATDPAFVVAPGSQPLMLASGGSATFTVAFAPTTSGAVEAQIRVYVEWSATAVAELAVTAVGTPDSAGGCCDAGRSPSSWSSLLLASSLIVILRRRWASPADRTGQRRWVRL